MSDYMPIILRAIGAGVNEALDMCNTPLEMSTKEQHRVSSH